MKKLLYSSKLNKKKAPTEVGRRLKAYRIFIYSDLLSEAKILIFVLNLAL